MKSRRMMSFLLLVTMFVSACQLLTPASTPTQEIISPSEEISQPTQVSPYPAQEYPGPVQAPPQPRGQGYPYPGQGAPPESVPVQPAMVYPDMKDGDQIIWPQVFGLLLSGEVTKVAQAEDLQVFLTLKDGRTFVTQQPSVDEILRMIESCGEACKDVLVETK